jgi:hypothetical protein
MSVDAKSPRHLGSRGLQIRRFWTVYRPPGSYPKTGVMSGLATIRAELRIPVCSRLSNMVWAISPKIRSTLDFSGHPKA